MRLLLLSSLFLVLLAPAWAKKDVPYAATPMDAVAKMLEMAGVRSSDVIYDLGCGDGRIVIEAARAGATGVGIDIDPVRIRQSQDNARQAGVADRVRFVEGSFFETDLSEATVVTMYLLPKINERLRPKLLAELEPGTRIVSYAFEMGDWKPRRTEYVKGIPIYLWVVPQPRE